MSWTDGVELTFLFCYLFGRRNVYSCSRMRRCAPRRIFQHIHYACQPTNTTKFTPVICFEWGAVFKRKRGSKSRIHDVICKEIIVKLEFPKILFNLEDELESLSPLVFTIYYLTKRWSNYFLLDYSNGVSLTRSTAIPIQIQFSHWRRPRLFFSILPSYMYTEWSYNAIGTLSAYGKQML